MFVGTLSFFFFLSPTTMSTIKDQFAAEEACMATEEEAKLVEWRAELVCLQRVAMEKSRWEAEEEQRWREEEEQRRKEERVEEEQQ